MTLETVFTYAYGAHLIDWFALVAALLMFGCARLCLSVR